ncbi:hypothetical protein ACVDG8_007780 [Mesorhizobium sp. ORM8.1]
MARFERHDRRASQCGVLAQWQSVHNLGEKPTRLEKVGGQTRKVWSDSKGRDVVEMFTIAGMGHGTPLQTGGGDGLGKAGPFMLDVGISSTRHTARFWELTKPDARSKAEAKAASGAALQSFARKEKPRAVRTDPTPESASVRAVRRAGFPRSSKMRCAQRG